MKRIASIALAGALCGQASALEVVGLADLVTQRASNDQRTSTNAKLIMAAYFASAADLLNLARQSSGELAYRRTSFACLPEGVMLNGEIIESIALQELRSLEESPPTEVPEWRRAPASVLISVAVAKHYPCITK